MEISSLELGFYSPSREKNKECPKINRKTSERLEPVVGRMVK